MTNNRKILLIGGLLLFGLLVVWLFTPDDTIEGERTNKKFYSSNWNKKYLPFDKNPKGTFLFHRLLQAHIAGKDMYATETRKSLDSVLNMDNKNRTFVFVGNIFALDDEEIDSIMVKVDKGSDLFLCYNRITENVVERFFQDYYLRSDYDFSELVYTSQGSYTMWNIYQKDTVAREWNAFGDITTQGDSKALSSFMEMDNFISIEMGKGKVFVHTNPIMLANYQLLRNDGFQYSKYVINQFSKNKDVVLLELGRMPDDFGNEDVDDQTGNDKKKDTSYLRVILEDEFLRTALILLIVGVILFVIFRSRRKRPIVPYQGKKKDMTLAFTETITSIYYSKQNPYGLLQVQRKNFYAVILKHFFVDLNRREGDRELRILSEKSNKPLDEIKEMVAILETKEVSRVNDQTISDMAKRKRAFYRDVGIISDRIEERVKKRELIFHRTLWIPAVIILLGLLFMIIGLYLLVQAMGIGIVLIPLGIVFTILGGIRLSNPYLVVTQNELIYYTDFGAKRVFNREDIIRATATKTGVEIQLHNDRKVLINYWDMSRFDREQFDRFISKVHTLDL